MNGKLYSQATVTLEVPLVRPSDKFQIAKLGIALSSPVCISSTAQTSTGGQASTGAHSMSELGLEDLKAAAWREIASLRRQMLEKWGELDKAKRNGLESPQEARPTTPPSTQPGDDYLDDLAADY